MAYFHFPAKRRVRTYCTLNIQCKITRAVSAAESPRQQGRAPIFEFSIVVCPSINHRDRLVCVPTTSGVSSFKFKT
jgi:hypothetical protein